MVVRRLQACFEIQLPHCPSPGRPQEAVGSEFPDQRVVPCAPNYSHCFRRWNQPPCWIPISALPMHHTHYWISLYSGRRVDRIEEQLRMG